MEIGGEVKGLDWNESDVEQWKQYLQGKDVQGRGLVKEDGTVDFEGMKKLEILLEKYLGGCVGEEGIEKRGERDKVQDLNEENLKSNKSKCDTKEILNGYISPDEIKTKLSTLSPKDPKSDILSQTLISSSLNSPSLIKISSFSHTFCSSLLSFSLKLVSDQLKLLNLQNEKELIDEKYMFKKASGLKPKITRIGMRLPDIRIEDGIDERGQEAENICFTYVLEDTNGNTLGKFENKQYLDSEDFKLDCKEFGSKPVILQNAKIQIYRVFQDSESSNPAPGQSDLDLFLDVKDTDSPKNSKLNENLENGHKSIEAMIETFNPSTKYIGFSTITLPEDLSEECESFQTETPIYRGEKCKDDRNEIESSQQLNGDSAPEDINLNTKLDTIGNISIDFSLKYENLEQRLKREMDNEIQVLDKEIHACSQQIKSTRSSLKSCISWTKSFGFCPYQGIYNCDDDQSGHIERISFQNPANDSKTRSGCCWSHRDEKDCCIIF
ncbi:unnamed protein product [Moneuplotes crassus]|uniref:Uncharacterized protein n=1 Tax=Euplotes crassus TaxID=5936 RepID=A0AAD1UC07_EUPCR|nr:unnamed protein product [Moneuplotes crassus]